MAERVGAPFSGDFRTPPETASRGQGDRVLCGWRVSSEWLLPGLPPWRGDDRAPDVVITAGPVPDRLGDLTIDQPHVQITADGFCRFAVPDMATYLIDPDGRRVVIDPAGGAAAQDIQLYLFGTVLGIVCSRRGLLPLHAGCVRIGDGAVAFAGASGMGKSTLAAALIRRGYPMLSDDVTAVEADADCGLRVRPSLPRLTLCPDAMARFGVPTGNAIRVQRDAAKFLLPVNDSFHPSTLPLTAIVHLRPATDGQPTSLHRLSGAGALAAILGDVYRPVLMRWLDRNNRLAHAALAVAAAPGGVWRLSYRHGAEGPDAALTQILGALAVPTQPC